MTATTDTKPLLELRRIVKVYGTGDTAVEVLHGINLTVTKGEMVAIMGQSGSGKSTLMNIIGTLDRATKGEYFLSGKNISELTSDQLAAWRGQKIGFVFQSFNLLPRLTVTQNVARPMLYAQVPPERRLKRVMVELERVGLAAKCDSYPLKLSGGQQQRVAIARALIMEPDLILADEPTGALDSQTAKQVMDEFVRVNRERGTTIILVTHDEKTANYAQRTIRMQDGTII